MSDTMQIIIGAIPYIISSAISVIIKSIKAGWASNDFWDGV